MPSASAPPSSEAGVAVGGESGLAGAVRQQHAAAAARGGGCSSLHAGPLIVLAEVVWLLLVALVIEQLLQDRVATGDRKGEG